MSKNRPNLKKTGPVGTAASWEHQHPHALGRVPGVLAQARTKLEVARSAMLSGLVAAIDVERAEQDFHRKESGTNKFRTAPSWLRLQSTGQELAPDEYLKLRIPLMEQYGYFLKDRGGKRKGEKFKTPLESAVFEEFAVECAPQVSYGLQAADEAGENIGAAVDLLFEGVPEEFERVTGFKVVLRARHTDEGILHDQLLWSKTDGAGGKLGLRRGSTRWSAMQLLKPAMVGARRWRALVGEVTLGLEKSKGIDSAVERRKRECRGVFELAPDAALADFVDGRVSALREKFPKLVPYLDAAEHEYRRAVELKLHAGLNLDEIFEREAKANAEAEIAKKAAIEAHDKASREEARRRQAEDRNAELEDVLKSAQSDSATARADQVQSQHFVDELRAKIAKMEVDADSFKTANISLASQLKSAEDRLREMTELVDKFAEPYGPKLESLIQCLSGTLTGKEPDTDHRARLVPSMGTHGAFALSSGWRDLLPVLCSTSKYGRLAIQLIDLDRSCRTDRVLNENELNQILAAAHRRGSGKPNRNDERLLSEENQIKVCHAASAGSDSIKSLASEVSEAVTQSLLIQAASTPLPTKIIPAKSGF